MRGWKKEGDREDLPDANFLELFPVYQNTPVSGTKDMGDKSFHPKIEAWMPITVISI